MNPIYEEEESEYYSEKNQDDEIFDAQHNSFSGSTHDTNKKIDNIQTLKENFREYPEYNNNNKKKQNKKSLVDLIVHQQTLSPQNQILANGVVQKELHDNIEDLYNVFDDVRFEHGNQLQSNFKKMVFSQPKQNMSKLINEWKFSLNKKAKYENKRSQGKFNFTKRIRTIHKISNFIQIILGLITYIITIVFILQFSKKAEQAQLISIFALILFSFCAQFWCVMQLKPWNNDIESKYLQRKLQQIDNLNRKIGFFDYFYFTIKYKVLIFFQKLKIMIFDISFFINIARAIMMELKLFSIFQSLQYYQQGKISLAKELLEYISIRVKYDNLKFIEYQEFQNISKFYEEEEEQLNTQSKNQQQEQQEQQEKQEKQEQQEQQKKMQKIKNQDNSNDTFSSNINNISINGVQTLHQSFINEIQKQNNDASISNNNNNQSNETIKSDIFKNIPQKIKIKQIKDFEMSNILIDDSLFQELNNAAFKNSLIFLYIPLSLLLNFINSDQLPPISFLTLTLNVIMAITNLCRIHSSDSIQKLQIFEKIVLKPKPKTPTSFKYNLENLVQSNFYLESLHDFQIFREISTQNGRQIKNIEINLQQPESNDIANDIKNQAIIQQQPQPLGQDQNQIQMQTINNKNNVQQNGQNQLNLSKANLNKFKKTIGALQVKYMSKFLIKLTSLDKLIINANNKNKFDNYPEILGVALSQLPFSPLIFHLLMDLSELQDKQFNQLINGMYNFQRVQNLKICVFNNNLSTGSTDNLFKLIKNLNNLRIIVLDVGYNKIDFKLMYEALQSKTDLLELSLTLNKVGMDSEGLNFLSDLFVKLKNLTYLNIVLCENLIELKEIQTLFQQITGFCRHLNSVKFDISNTRSNSEVFKQLGDVILSLAPHGNFVFMNQNNFILDQEDLRLLTTSFQVRFQLREIMLDFTNNKILDQGAKYIANIIKSQQKLVNLILFLQNNQIQDEGANEILDALQNIIQIEVCFVNLQQNMLKLEKKHQFQLFQKKSMYSIFV